MGWPIMLHQREPFRRITLSGGAVTQTAALVPPAPSRLIHQLTGQHGGALFDRSQGRLQAMRHPQALFSNRGTTLAPEPAGSGDAQHRPAASR